MAQMVDELSLENNKLVDGWIAICQSSGTTSKDIDDILISFEKLLRKLQGLPYHCDLFALEIACVCNYYNVIMSRIKSGEQSLAWGPRTYNNNSPADGLTGHMTSRGTSATRIEDVMAHLLMKIKQLTNRQCDQTAITSQCLDASVFELVKELNCIWLSGESKCFLVQIIIIHCLRLTINQYSTDVSVELSVVLLESAFVSQLSSINFSKSQRYKFKLLSLLPLSADTEQCGGFAYTLLKDSILLTVALCQFKALNFEQCFAYLSRIENEHIASYANYVEGLLIYNSTLPGGPTRAVDVLNMLCRTESLPRMLLHSGHLLLASCLSGQEKHHRAVQIYKRCLLDDISNLQPLYCVAEEYQLLSMYEAELETLQLLVKLVRDFRSDDRTSSNQFLLESVTNEILLGSSHPEITEAQALYALAKCYQRLERFEQAADAFSDLLSKLTNNTCSTILSSHFMTNASVIPLPPMMTIYAQVIHSQLCASRYDRSIELCNEVSLKCGRSSQSLEIPCDSTQAPTTASSSIHPTTSHRSVGEKLIPGRNQILVSTETMSGSDRKVDVFKLPASCRKRQRSEKEMNGDSGMEEEDKDGFDWSDNLIGQFNCEMILLYKAESLFHLRKFQESLSCINSVVSTVEQSWLSDIASDEAHQQSAKKRRSACDTKNNSHDQCRIHKRILSDAFHLKSVVLHSLDRCQDALHWSRLAVNLCADGEDQIEKIFSLVSVLLQVVRTREAVDLWFTHRGITQSQRGSCQQLSLILQQKADGLQCIQPSPTAACLLDPTVSAVILHLGAAALFGAAKQFFCSQLTCQPSYIIICPLMMAASSVLPGLEKFKFLTRHIETSISTSTCHRTSQSSPLIELERYVQQVQNLSGITSALDFWQQNKDSHSLIAPLAEDLVLAPASEAFVERIFSVPGMLSTRCNRVRKSLEMRVFLKLNKKIIDWE